MSETAAYKEASRLARYGWRVVPIVPGEKRPSMKGWQHAATNSQKTIDNWWKGIYRSHGLGVATGAQPNGQNLIVIDIDEHGESGTATMAALVKKHGELPETLEVETGNNGRHIYLLAPPELEVRNDAGRALGVGIDIRGDGGQVLAPPTVHPNGTPYRWAEGRSPDECTPKPAPRWLLDAIRKKDVAPPTTTLSNDGSDSPAARYNDRTTWDGLLSADGWTLVRTDSDGEQHWTRPGKQGRDGTSATVGYRGQDVLVVFTSSVPWLPPGAYSRFGYYACRHHNGDRSEAARTLLREEHPTTPAETPDTESDIDRDLLSMLIDWPTFWSQDHSVAEWLAEPLIAEHRAHAIFAPGGTGKSLLALWLAAAVATGTPIFGHAGRSRCVLYLDYEMTGDDLSERLIGMGYGAEHDLSNLRYALLPSLSSLDGEEGGRQVQRLARLVGAELVVIDTFGRAVSGDENDADTVRSFYRHTGYLLKQDGVASVRIDHAGKNLDKGQRGSSAKNDDVDIVWEMTKRGDRFVLKTRKARMGWVPQQITLAMSDEPIVYRLVTDGVSDSKVAECLDALQDLDIDPSLSERKVAALVRDHGLKVGSDALRVALRSYRQQAAGDGLDSYLV